MPYAITTYSLAGAEGEVLLLLLIAFVLGVLFGNLITRKINPEDKPIALLPDKWNRIKQDDLKIIDGIEQESELLLKESGIFTFKTLSQTPIKRLNTILSENGEVFKRSNPKSWPMQAKFARDGEWEKLRNVQKDIQ